MTVYIYIANTITRGMWINNTNKTTGYGLALYILLLSYMNSIVTANMKIMKYTKEKFLEIIDYWTEVCPVEKKVEILSPPQIMKSNAGYYVGRMCYDEDCNAIVKYDRMTEYYTDKAEAVKKLGEVQGSIQTDSGDGWSRLDESIWDAEFWDLAVFAEIIEPNK